MTDAALTADIAWLRDRAFMTEKGGDEAIYERIAKRLEALWDAYRIAHSQAMSNGSALAQARASGMEASQGGNEVPCEARQPDPKGTPKP